MNTAIQDAYNLAWKLAAAVSGSTARAGSSGAAEVDEVELERLLASYESERRPVALVNTALSHRNWEEALKVRRLLRRVPNRHSSRAAARQKFAILHIVGAFHFSCTSMRVQPHCKHARAHARGASQAKQ